MESAQINPISYIIKLANQNIRDLLLRKKKNFHTHRTPRRDRYHRNPCQYVASRFK